jgi:hypothetical protein
MWTAEIHSGQLLINAVPVNVKYYFTFPITPLYVQVKLFTPAATSYNRTLARNSRRKEYCEAAGVKRAQWCWGDYTFHLQRRGCAIVAVASER